MKLSYILIKQLIALFFIFIWLITGVLILTYHFSDTEILNTLNTNINVVTVINLLCVILACIFLHLLGAAVIDKYLDRINNVKKNVSKGSEF